MGIEIEIEIVRPLDIENSGGPSIDAFIDGETDRMIG